MNFSLIGLLVTMCVAAILASNAMSNGLQQAERAQVRQAVRDLQWIRNDLAEFTVGCELNPNTLSAGLSSLPHYTTATCTPGASIAAQGGAVGGLISSAGLSGLVLTATLGGAVLPGLKGQQLTLTGHVINGALSWTCSGPAGMIAATC
jgi:hypothetical protein